MSIKLLEKTKTVFTEKDFINFLKNEGITVKTNTKARGNLGICFQNRIDISQKADETRRIAILAHEYAHKIHFDIEKDLYKKGGSLEKLFNTANTEIILKELLAVTNFVDENSKFGKFFERKFDIDLEIKLLEKVIKQEYPDFKKSGPFKPINSYFRKNKSYARYLLKYDNVKIIHPFTRKEEFFCIKNLDKDFPEIPEALRAYIKLNAFRREYSRLYRRKNKAQRYYRKPTELFARFIEGIFTNQDEIKNLAPTTYSRFTELLKQDYYGNLEKLFIMADLY